MKIEAHPLFHITSITNSAGQRLGHYIIDPSKDSTHRDKRAPQDQPHEADHHSCKEDGENSSSDDANEPTEEGSASHVNITA